MPPRPQTPNPHLLKRHGVAYCHYRRRRARGQVLTQRRRLQQLLRCGQHGRRVRHRGHRCLFAGDELAGTGWGGGDAGVAVAHGGAGACQGRTADSVQALCRPTPPLGEDRRQACLARRNPWTWGPRAAPPEPGASPFGAKPGRSMTLAVCPRRAVGDEWWRERRRRRPPAAPPAALVLGRELVCMRVAPSERRAALGVSRAAASLTACADGRGATLRADKQAVYVCRSGGCDLIRVGMGKEVEVRWW